MGVDAARLDGTHVYCYRSGWSGHRGFDILLARCLVDMDPVRALMRMHEGASLPVLAFLTLLL
jgi:hypothetical protein